MSTTKDFHRTLPAKRMAAGAILRDSSSRVLVVEPTYKTDWELPGGVVEAGESPLAAAIREIREELSLTFLPEHFLLAAVDYLDETDDRTEALQFVFAGPTLCDSDIAGIALCRKELKSFTFLHPDAAAVRLGRIVGPRLLRSLEALVKGTVTYWEAGSTAGP